MTTANPAGELLPHLFRKEYSKLTAVLSRLFGLQHIEIAQDIASDTFLKASEVWGIRGLPENPTAWLYVVAKNKAKDYLKSQRFSSAHFEELEEILPGTDHTGTEFSQKYIEDSQLEMIFSVCNPVNPPEGQICLALQILGGFSIEEIANAFLTNKETIKKRLYRARETLRSHPFNLQIDAGEIAQRLDSVLKTVYLLFNEGYFSMSNNDLVRRELCEEAVRLAYFLAENPHTSCSRVYALLALLCYQSSRLDARVQQGEAVLFDEQDKKLWAQTLIDRGNYYLTLAFTAGENSKYHLEACIAYWHTTDVNDKWEHILQLYNQLLLIEYSPSAALNRSFVVGKVFGAPRAIAECEKLALGHNHYYHSLLGYLYAHVDKQKAVFHYETAISLASSDVEKKRLKQHLDELGNK